jgi:hypothetical protein
VLRPAIDRVFSLDDIVGAHHYLEEGRQAGKLVSPSEPGLPPWITPSVHAGDAVRGLCRDLQGPVRRIAG